MLVEFLLEVFFIKVHLKGYLQNLTENTKDIIETTGIINKNKITYYDNSIKYTIEKFKDKVFLKRENEEFIHGIVFKQNELYDTEYYIKELNTSLTIKIKTKKIYISDNKIEVNYEIIDNSNDYLYIIEMSDKQ